MSVVIEDVVKSVLSYNSTADTDLIVRAYEFAREAHKGQVRLSGEEYIIHPLEIALILSELHMDVETIAAGLLHDVIEDTEFTYEDLHEQFGKDIADLVDGVTKIAKLQYKSKEEQQIDSFRKMFVAMADDIRVIMIKLVDRLHNMRTLSAMRPDKQIQKSNETLDIYVPIAHRLGISKIKWEFEDLAFRYLKPDDYYSLVDAVKQKRSEREEYIDKVINILSDKLELENISAEIKGRPKHLYSIYNKMLKGKDFHEIYDLIAIRVLVNSISDCYAVLGYVHTLWKPLPGRIKDYIAMPKPNLYQSLHTAVVGPGGTAFEIQIRTYDMHKVSEFGVAAHWKYKEGKKGSDELGEKLKFLLDLKEIDDEVDTPVEYVDSVRSNLYIDEVYVYTPKGRIVEVPKGATPIDFAYRIHSDIGHKCVGAKITGKMVPLTYQLKKGDIVEIMTNPSSKGPSRDWLNVVVSSHARNKIKAFFRKAEREENIIKGKEMFEKDIRHNKLATSDIVKSKYLEYIQKRFNANSWEDIYASIGYGGLRGGYVIQRIKENFKKDFDEVVEKQVNVVAPPKNKNRSNMVIIQGYDDLALKFAKCCQPVMGDKIVGYITKGSGISVHRTDCSNICNCEEKERLIDVTWIDRIVEEKQFTGKLLIRAMDRQRLIGDITTLLGNEGVSITKFTSKVDDQGVANINFDIVIKNIVQLELLIKKIEMLKNIIYVKRI